MAATLALNALVHGFFLHSLRVLPWCSRYGSASVKKSMSHDIVSDAEFLDTNKGEL